MSLNVARLPNGQEFTKVMQEISTNGGGFVIYSVEWNRLGDLVESGGIANLDDFVAAHHSPDAISRSWPEQYGYFGGGGAAMTCAFSDLLKFPDNPANEGSMVTGKVGSMLPPGPRSSIRCDLPGNRTNGEGPRGSSRFCPACPARQSK